MTWLISSLILHQSILDDPQVGALKDYINDYNGKIAERNGGKNGFSEFGMYVLPRKLNLIKWGFELSVDIFNVANLLNKEWGVNKSYGNTSLYRLKVQSGTKQFEYTKNISGTVCPSQGIHTRSRLERSIVSIKTIPHKSRNLPFCGVIFIISLNGYQKVIIPTFINRFPNFILII
jgi:hypothetical protein